MSTQVPNERQPWLYGHAGVKREAELAGQLVRRCETNGSIGWPMGTQVETSSCSFEEMSGSIGRPVDTQVQNERQHWLVPWGRKVQTSGSIDSGISMQVRNERQ